MAYINTGRAGKNVRSNDSFSRQPNKRGAKIEKKLIARTLVGMMRLSLLPGCGGKSEEQQARDEIQQHQVDEAVEDGFDLQGMAEQEAADSQARAESREQERAEREQANQNANA